MKININKDGDFFFASLHDSEGALVWKNENPQDRTTLTQELINAGCHKIDVYDEFERVDPTVSLESGLSEDVKKTYLASLKTRDNE